jgi:rhamnosyltransferase
MDVSAVIVAYNPDRQTFAELLEKIAPQVSRVLIVDNGSPGALGEVPGYCEVTRLGENRGLASAQNIGIRRALSLGSDFILLLDHDSIPEDNMVAVLLSAHAELSTRMPIAALGANYLERRSGRWLIKDDSQYVEAMALGSSGCLIAKDVMLKVGPMQEDLFVDYVDFEWSFRAGKMGKMFIVRDARMTHTLGAEPVIWRGRMLHYGGTSRIYYQARNSAHLYARADVPLRWKYLDFKLRLISLAAAMLGMYPGRRMDILKAMLRGTWHGLIGRLGPIQS